MPHLLPSCVAPPRQNAGLTSATSLYETHLGLVSLTWSPAVFGVSLSADLRLYGAGTAAPSTASSFIKHEYEEEEEEEEYGDQEKRSSSFYIRPWVLWKRRGSKKFHIRNGSYAESSNDREVEFIWDLTRARFSPSGGPEPASGFYVALVVDHEMLLVAGDLQETAYRRTKLLRNPSAALISRREHAVMRNHGYRTVARFGGTEREILIRLSPEKGMAVEIDGDQMLRIRRLRWKFRGCEKVQTEDGNSIQISWDLHDWIFGFGPCNGFAPTEEKAHAKFVFKFEKPVGTDWCELKGPGWGYFGKTNSRGSSGSEKGRKKSFSSMTSSMTSLSVSGSSSSVMDWTSSEEVEMRRGEAFSFLVYLSR
ncbi:hypothetical protein LUZ60_000923 [Juncus effusus]|nr:hypothetical protein LUZ60_000923 [Juncus effusus]